MLFCLGLIAILLYDTVFVNATCSQTLDQFPGQLDAISQHYHELGHRHCEYVLRAPRHELTLLLNFTVIYGFEAPPSTVQQQQQQQQPPPQLRHPAKSTKPGGSPHPSASADLPAPLPRPSPPLRRPPPVPEEEEDDDDSLSLDALVPAKPSTLDSAASVPCLPSLELAELLEDGSVSGMRCICRSSAEPLVFVSSTPVIRLTYVWVAHRPSGFSLRYDFRPRAADGPCEFSCADRGGCLASWTLVCNGIADCADQSDEQDCPLPLPSSGSPRHNVGADDVSSIQIIIIVIAIVLTLGIVTCVVSHYKMGARSWSERRDRHPNHTQHGHHHHADLNASTVLYLPNTSQERLHREREMAALHDRQIRNKSVQLDLELDLPPSIALPDGEEGPHNNLLHLQLRDQDQESEINRECIRPPPNRTVYERDSPPPYRSSSVGVLHSEPNGTPPPHIARGWSGTPLVMRCHSMSTNNNATMRNGNHSGGSSSSSMSLSHSPPLPCHHPHPPPPTNLTLESNDRQSAKL